MPEQLDSLRSAAATLLAGAPQGAVLAAVRALLDGWEDTAPAVAVRPPQAAWRATDNAAQRKPAKPPAAAVAPPAKAAELAAWEQLRLGSMRRAAASATK